MSAQPAGPSRSHALEAFLRQETDEHRRVFDSLLADLAGPFERTLAIWEAAVRAGGKLLLFGNGGSAADAQHLAAELVIRYHTDRPPIAAIALTTDTSALTAGANDFGFDRVFSRQIEALGRPGDVAVGISTSGRSPNVLAGLRTARTGGLHTTGLTGGPDTAAASAGAARTGGAAITAAASAATSAMPSLCDALLIVPSTVTARIQEMHILLGHMLCKALEQRLGLLPAPAR